MTRCRTVFSVAACLFAFLLASAQDAKKPGILEAQEVKKLAPESYYFAAQSAPVQVRNCVGFRTSSGKIVLAGLVDTSGYATDIQQKYQGFLITETKLDIGGSELVPGEYGFGFRKDGKFGVMDVAANDLLSATASRDTKLLHPVPLKMVEEAGGYKLYGGRNWVTLKPE
jgi:hypothetical protein